MLNTKFMLYAACLTLALSFNNSAHAAPEKALVPGGIALLKLPDYDPYKDKGSKVYFNNKRIAVFQKDKEWFAMAGIGLSTKPGEYAFSIDKASMDKTSTNNPNKNAVTTKITGSKITVAHKKYDEQHLTIKNKRKVNPNKQDTDRIIAESKRKKKAKKQFTETPANVDFIWPVTGRISSIFGLRRFFNEQERRPHSGLDIAAAEGTPIKATADGIVIDSGDFFFSGNMIYLDHGQGIVSLYAHLSRIAVKPGDVVKQGDVIGDVGQTGRVTGPHLHFAIIANQTLIDPLFMLPRNGNENGNEKESTDNNPALTEKQQ